MSTIEKLRDFLMQCPFLQAADEMEHPNVYIDYLSENPTAYTIQVIPTAQIIKRYSDGGGVKQTAFAFRSIEIYDGREIQQNINNIAFYEQFSAWLEEAEPTIEDWIKVEALTDGYFFDVAEGQDKATYQIQCRILYNF